MSLLIYKFQTLDNFNQKDWAKNLNLLKHEMSQLNYRLNQNTQIINGVLRIVEEIIDEKFESKEIRKEDYIILKQKIEEKLIQESIWISN